MIDVDTFVTILYVMVDDFCQSRQCGEARHPGPAAALSCSEIVALALFGQWVQFPSERAFYRYAEHHLRAAFPTLPDRAPVQSLATAIACGACGVWFVPGANATSATLSVRVLGLVGHSDS